MSQTKQGGATLRNTMIARYQAADPSLSHEEAYEAWKQSMRDRASVGGSRITTRPKGFAANRALASIAGAKGGSKSKRPKKA
jgi:hypothetical protein